MPGSGLLLLFLVAAHAIRIEGLLQGHGLVATHALAVVGGLEAGAAGLLVVKGLAVAVHALGRLLCPGNAPLPRRPASPSRP